MTPLSDERIVEIRKDSICADPAKLWGDSIAFARAIERAVAEQSQWVSVNERVPELDAPVIVALASGGIAIDEWCVQRESPVGWSSVEIQTGEMWGNHEFEDITHWMPLPAAPAAAGGEEDAVSAPHN